MKKAEIETYFERGMGRLPSINVKVGYRKFAPGLTAEMLNCDEATFEKATTFAFEAAQQRFWDDAQETASYHLCKRPGCLDRDIKVHAVGRQGGHLVVEGLDPVETWNAITVSAWGRFVHAIEDQIDYHCNTAMIEEDILANQWNEPGAEFYNFIDMKNKTTVCLSVMKADAEKAGFGPVIRA